MECVQCPLPRGRTTIRRKCRVCCPPDDRSGTGHSKLQGYKVAHPKTVARGAPPTPERLDNSQIGG